LKAYIAYDLGTGGIKASLYDRSLRSIARVFIEYQTFYPGEDRQEQRPEDWWQAVCESTRQLLAETRTPPEDIACLAVSGQSLAAIPIDRNKKALLEQIPIWSDTRAKAESERFFNTVDREGWYLATGNGFPAPCYSLFKIMWFKEHQGELYANTYKFIGSKDYINLRLTGEIRTDYSYASGTGAYHLLKKQMWKPFLDAACIAESLFPRISPSHEVIGRVSREAAGLTCLAEGTPVACGAVDNACMALGAVGVQEGSVYVSLGSSSWIPVNSSRPVLDSIRRPYVFAHADERMYTSAYSIFAGGSSLRWVKETLCRDIMNQPDVYDRMICLAALSPPGANGIIFNPSLAGGTSQDKSINIRGAFLNLHLSARREDLIRAAMEGIALNLRASLLHLQEYTKLRDRILFCGGGARSAFWMQMFADVFGMQVITTNIDQDAASLGAAAIAARASGAWDDYAAIPGLHEIRQVFLPDEERHMVYLKLFRKFMRASDMLAGFGDSLQDERGDLNTLREKE
jgi:xylulokinase